MTMMTDTQGLARTSTAIALANRLTAVFSAIAAIVKSRRAIADIEALDDRLLADVGLTRLDVSRARDALTLDPISVLMQARRLTISRS